MHSFATHGYEATSLGEIAEAAGVTRTVLYDHFASKRELFLAVLTEQAEALLADVARGITGAGPAQERMRKTIDAFLLAVHERPFAAQVLLMEATADADVRAAQGEVAARVNAALRELLGADLRRAGLDPAEDAAAAAIELIVSGLVGLARWWPAHPDVAREQLTAIAMGVLWHGLRVAGSLTTDTSVG